MSTKEKEPLTALQQEILIVFNGIEESREFYFTGGSALASYHFRHRLSEDIDFFTSVENIIGIAAARFKAAMEKRGSVVDFTRSFKNFVEMVVKKGEESTRVQLALDSPYRLDEARDMDGVRVDSLLDIAAGKLLALFARAEERDFVDLYFLVKEGHFDLDDLIEKASEKDPGMDRYFLAAAFEQVRKLPDEPGKLKLRLLKSIDIKELKRLFIEKAVKILENERSGAG